MDTGRLFTECERAARAGRIAHFRWCRAALEQRGILDTDGLAAVAEETSNALRLLADAEVAAVVGKLRVPMVKAAAVAVTAALKAGASREFLVAAEVKAESVREIVRRTAEDAQAADLRGRRRSTRHSVPRLAVRVGDAEFRTLDWSSCGISVSGIPDVRDDVRIHVGYDGIDGGYVDGVVGRVDGMKGVMAIDFGKPSLAMLTLKAKLYRAGIAIH